MSPDIAQLSLWQVERALASLRVVSGFADRHVFDHAPAQRADGLLGQEVLLS
jgi:hypothetical protein